MLTVLGAIKSAASIAFGLTVIVLVVCGWIGGDTSLSVSMPDYGHVYVDDEGQRIVSAACLPASSLPSDLRSTTMGEALRLRYNLDRDCIDQGGFQEGGSVPRALLHAIHLAPQQTYWWDKPYRTAEGIVYPPATEPDTSRLR